MNKISYFFFKKKGKLEPIIGFIFVDVEIKVFISFLILFHLFTCLKQDSQPTRFGASLTRMNHAVFSKLGPATVFRGIVIGLGVFGYLTGLNTKQSKKKVLFFSYQTQFFSPSGRCCTA